MKRSIPKTAVLALAVALGFGPCLQAANPVKSGGAGAGPAVDRQAPGRLPPPPPPRPNDANRPPPPPPGEGGGPAGYTIEQAISDRAQQSTIGFDALAFLTGSLGADSFFPPGKVADFWGFQFLRDNDPTGMGHNTDFLTRAAFNMLAVLDAGQRAQLLALAQGQVETIDDFAYERFVLMTAFRRLLAGALPAGTSGLDEASVRDFSSGLYAIDGQLSIARAEVLGAIIYGLTNTQRAALDRLVGTGMLTWPNPPEPDDLRGLPREVKVAVMTYAADLFSWYGGSVTADTYFCPERHGTYFGAFYLKDAPAVGNPGYSIPTTMTGDLGAALIALLAPDQAALVTGLVEIQRPALNRIVEVRRAVATELRRAQTGGAPDHARVMALMEEYGALDGAIAYQYATHFAALAATLGSAQQAQLLDVRHRAVGDYTPAPAYLYAQPIALPEVRNTDFLFR